MLDGIAKGPRPLPTDALPADRPAEARAGDTGATESRPEATKARGTTKKGNAAADALDLPKATRAKAKAAVPAAKELFPTALRATDVATPADAAEKLGLLLGAPDLTERALAVAARLPEADRTRFTRALGTMALVADTARTMLDYDKLTTGWSGFSDYAPKYPMSKSEYRRRLYTRDSEERSAPRQERSRAEIAESVRVAIESMDAAGARGLAALEDAVVARFFDEVGVHADTRRDWKPTFAAVEKAIDAEMLIPLRALYAAAAHLDHQGVPLYGHKEDELNAACRKVMEDVIRHVGEGDFEDWRFSHEASQKQLASLTPEQLQAFRAPTAIEKDTRSGSKLTTRDEQGLGLAWVTKIGGPSHGFDMISQCLFPLLVNARNAAIVVDDDQHEGAARSILRMLPTDKGQPMLYLEMLQVDYPYERTTRVTRDEVRGAIVEHALAKAKAMGVPLAIAPSRHESAELVAKQVGVYGERTPLVFVLEPSGGVFESSDTLLGAHHAPQTKQALARIPEYVPLWTFNKPWCFVIDPA